MLQHNEPRRTGLVFQQARRHQQNGEIGEAVTLYGQVLAARPRHTPSLLHLGEIALSTGNLDQAEVLLAKALEIDPRFPEAHDVLWQVKKERGDIAGAMNVLYRRLELRPQDPYAEYNLGILLREEGKLEEARTMFAVAAQQRPDDVRLQVTLGNVLRELGKISEAAACYRRAVALEPRNAMLQSNLAYLLSRKGDCADALVHYSRAVALDPENETLRQNHWQALLRVGAYREGFADAEARFSFKSSRNLHAPYEYFERWNGEDFPGRVLVYHEQSVEDTLQYARYLRLIKNRVGHLSVALPTEMQRLFHTFNFIDEMITNTPDALRGAAVDQIVSFSSLPAVFGTMLQSIPRHFPYLFPEPFLVHSWVPRLDWQTYRVGIAWQTEEGSQDAVQIRSCPLAAMEPLAKLAKISFYSLQMESKATNATSDFPVKDYGTLLRDQADLAALMANLDLVITIDAVQAHLAAAIGKEVWLMLPFEASWRWMQGRDDSPWYPHMKLFRQTRPGDWDGVIRRVAAALGPTSRPHRQFQLNPKEKPVLFGETAVSY